MKKAVCDVFYLRFSLAAGVTPEKVREDLEKSLTDLTNLSLSMCNSEEVRPW